MTTPAIRTIRQNFPQAEISVLVHPWGADVFSASPYIDRIINYYKKTTHKGLPGMWRLAWELKAEHFDLAILLQNAFEAALITRMAGIPLRAGYSRDGRRLLLSHAVPLPQQRKTVHQVHYYQGLLTDLGLTPGPNELFLALRDEDRERAAGLINRDDSGPLIGLNPGASYGPAKRWPVKKYAQLAEQLIKKLNARIVIFGTGADQQAASRIKNGHSRIIDLSAKTSLAEAMALIDACAVFVTNDSGLMHVASALHTPLVAIFGSTNPVTTGPYTDNAVVIRHPMPCSPCMQTDCHGNFACMEDIGPDEVGAAVISLLR